MKVPRHLERISQEDAWDRELRQVQETPTADPQEGRGGGKGLGGKAGRED